ncbi:hypothetical protein DAPPUDRAFT_304744 [Daphnia pulex]|uniref:Uncharacterized protein n=1 Tax=Daphnia pulex TaxID=6669 RepID=E9FUB7_DAPPU|nr:hypothetical protein DAPPUDRAFT_304744 [Daphnia pulex]|eukprot:EFX88697.1 hypothetical protein DAPPUDRAFT_304744 [Daphnia pulex]
MMRFFVSLVTLCIVTVQGKAQYQPYYDDSFYQYPSYPVAAGRTPNVVYDNRFLFGYTSTTTATTTTTTTCTVYTNVACLASGRRRRFLEDDDDIVDPSPVIKVESTEIAEMDGNRKERKPNPQVKFGHESDYPYYELRSTIGQRLSPNSYNPYIRRPVIAADPRFLIYTIGFITTTTTSTSTVTSRSTPVCSAGSGFNQC